MLLWDSSLEQIFCYNLTNLFLQCIIAIYLSCNDLNAYMLHFHCNWRAGGPLNAKYINLFLNGLWLVVSRLIGSRVNTENDHKCVHGSSPIFIHKVVRCYSQSCPVVIYSQSRQLFSQKNRYTFLRVLIFCDSNSAADGHFISLDACTHTLYAWLRNLNTTLIWLNSSLLFTCTVGDEKPVTARVIYSIFYTLSLFSH